MTGHQTYHLRCNGCGRVYRPSATLDRAPHLLQEVRDLAVQESWKYELVQTLQGPAPSVDFCNECDDTVRAETIARIIGEKTLLKEAP